MHITCNAYLVACNARKHFLELHGTRYKIKEMDFYTSIFLLDLVCYFVLTDEFANL